MRASPRGISGILLIAIIAAVLIPAVSAYCSVCEKGGAEAAWEKEVASFLEGNASDANSSASSTSTVYSAKVDRGNNPSLKSFGFSGDTGSNVSNTVKDTPQQSTAPQIQASQIQSSQKERKLCKSPYTANWCKKCRRSA